jgi:hypothetical protein
MFAFKFYNNILGLNQRTTHFAVNPVRYCQFCHMTNVVNPPDESFTHLFLLCPTVQAWHDQFLSTKLGIVDITLEEKKKFWFLGIPPHTDSPSYAVLSAVLIIQYCVWEEKLRKRIPSYRTINLMFEDIFFAGIKSNKRFLKSASNLNYAIFRPVQGLYGPPD